MKNSLGQAVLKVAIFLLKAIGSKALADFFRRIAMRFRLHKSRKTRDAVYRDVNANGLRDDRYLRKDG